MGLRGLAFLMFLYGQVAVGQLPTRYDQFEIKNGDLVWTNTYRYEGKQDSLRAAVVQMLKSKYYTFNVIRNEIGYNGELKHYKVDCKKYGRSYINTPRLYWEGEWTGKFKVEVADQYYQVTVYALYYESMQKSTDYYKTDRLIKGRFIDAVTKKRNTLLRKNEFQNLALMGLSLKDAFRLLRTNSQESD